MNETADMPAVTDSPSVDREDGPADLKRILAPIAPRMDALELVIERLIRDDAARYFPEAGEICCGGKRLRGAVCIASAAAMTHDESRIERAIEVAACIEGIHFSSLLHDDVIDEATERRGIATLHRKYGRTGAILAGDLLYVRIFNRLIEIDRDGLMKTITHGTEEMVEGETLETLCATMGRVPDRAGYLKCISKKTAAFFGASAKAGAIVALPSNGSERGRTHAAFYRFGHELGMAFQIIDDLLDWTAEETAFGKDFQADIRSGKITLPGILFLEEERSEAERLIAEARAGSPAALLDALSDRGYLVRTREVAYDHAENALGALAEAGVASPLLRELVEFSLSRTY